MNPKLKRHLAPDQNSGIRITNPEVLKAINKIALEMKPRSSESNRFPELLAIHQNELNRQRKISGYGHEFEMPVDKQEQKRAGLRMVIKRSAQAMIVLLMISFYNIFSHQTETIPVFAMQKVEDGAIPATKLFAMAQLSNPSTIESTAKKIQHYSLDRAPQKPFHPIPFESIRVSKANGKANIKWSDSVQDLPVTYVVEQSIDGRNFEILNVFDSKPSKDENVFLSFADHTNRYYRMIKIVHGGNVFHSKVFNPEENAVAFSDIEFFDLDSDKEVRPS